MPGYTSFRDFMNLRESRQTHKNGTYVAAYVSPADAQKLYHQVKKIIPGEDLHTPGKYHTTIVYSRIGKPQLEKINFPSITGNIKQWKIFPTQTGSRCLVLLIDSPLLERIHKNLHSLYRLSYDFPDYIPHITVCYDYKGSLPEILPEINHINYDRVIVEPLDD